MTVLEQLVRAEALAFLLEGCRIAGLVVVAPLAWTPAPARIRVALVLVLTLAAHGAGAATHTLGSGVLVFIAAASEFGLGALLGFVVRMVVAIAEVGAEVIAPMMGLSAAHLFDPHLHLNETVLATLFRNLTVLLALIAGVHRVVLGVTLESFHVLPAGQAIDLAASASLVVRFSADSLISGVRIAIPAVAILFMTHVALAFISRAAPAMQIFSVGFAVTLGVGTMVLILAAPDLSQRLLAELSHLDTDLESVIAVVAQRPP